MLDKWQAISFLHEKLRQKQISEATFRIGVEHVMRSDETGYHHHPLRDLGRWAGYDQKQVGRSNKVLEKTNFLRVGHVKVQSKGRRWVSNDHQILGGVIADTSVVTVRNRKPVQQRESIADTDNTIPKGIEEEPATSDGAGPDVPAPSSVPDIDEDDPEGVGKRVSEALVTSDTRVIDRANENEGLFEFVAETSGWEVTKRGWPDFVGLNENGEMIAVEVKPRTASGFLKLLKAEQVKVMDMLSRNGIACFVSDGEEMFPYVEGQARYGIPAPDDVRAAARARAPWLSRKIPDPTPPIRNDQNAGLFVEAEALERLLLGQGFTKAERDGMFPAYLRAYR